MQLEVAAIECVLCESSSAASYCLLPGDGANCERPAQNDMSDRSSSVMSERAVCETSDKEHLRVPTCSIGKFAYAVVLHHFSSAPMPGVLLEYRRC